MEPYFIHLLKSSGILLLFLGCYLIFLKKETFFDGNRWFLLSGIAFALFAPFISITEVVILDSNLFSGATINNALTTGTTTAPSTFNWNITLLPLYLAGVLVFGLRLLVQLWTINHMIKNGKLLREQSFYHVQTQKTISPFSFFKYLFYHKDTFNPSELKSIIAHEKVHAREYHSLDILIMESLVIFLWFNPLVWLYRTCLKQNLEFLADSKSCTAGEGKTFYQYLMLKQVMGPKSMTLANPFYSSLIKKRIVMLNQNHSKKTRMLKMLVVFPALTLFLMAFNTKTVYKNEIGQDNVHPNIAQDNSISVVIDKDTSDAELERIKSDLQKKNVDFSYTVVHNSNNEIIGIDLHISGRGKDGDNFSGSYSSNSNSPISPISMYYDGPSNSVSFGNSSYKNIQVHSANNHASVNVRVDSENGHNVEVHEDMNHDTEKDGHVIIERLSEDGNTENNIMIRHGDQHDEMEFSGNDRNLIFNYDGTDKPLFYVNGKKTTKKEVEKLAPHDIETIEVLKGESAINKYGKKAKNGVVEITTKKRNQ